MVEVKESESEKCTSTESVITPMIKKCTSVNWCLLQVMDVQSSSEVDQEEKREKL
jgi:hypothetical protein